MEERLENAWIAAREAWPSIDLPRPELAFSLNRSPDATHTNDLYFARALELGIPAALVAFEDLLRAVPKWVARLPVSETRIEELRQEVRVGLLVPPRRKIATYKGRGPFAAWVRVVTVRLALEELRRDTPRPLEQDSLVTHATPELLALKRQAGAAVNQALATAFAALPEQDRALLKMYFLDGLGLAVIGGLLGVHTATAARRLIKVRETLYEACRAAVRKSGGGSTTDLESLVRLALSAAELSA